MGGVLAFVSAANCLLLPGRCVEALRMLGISVIQVAKQVRTVPVRGCDAEKGFDAEKCDLGNCAFPPSPHPNFFR